MWGAFLNLWIISFLICTALYETFEYIIRLSILQRRKILLRKDLSLSEDYIAKKMKSQDSNSL